MPDASIGCYHRSYPLFRASETYGLLLWPACLVLRLHCSHFSRVSCISGSDFLHVISLGVGGMGGAFCYFSLGSSSLFIDWCVVCAASSLLLLFSVLLSSQMRLMAPSVEFTLRTKGQKSCLLLSLLGFTAVLLLGSMMRYILSAVKLSLPPYLHSVVACRVEIFICSEACITRVLMAWGLFLGSIKMMRVEDWL